MKQENYFTLLQGQIKSKFKKLKIDIDYSDDDTFSDWLQNNYKNLDFGTLQLCFSYNAMLQSIAMTPFDVEFIINHHIENKN